MKTLLYLEGSKKIEHRLLILARSLWKFFQDQSIEVTILADQGLDEFAPQLIDFPYHRLNNEVSKDSGKELRSYLEQEKPQIAIFFSTGGFGFLFFSIASQGLGIRSICSLQEVPETIIKHPVEGALKMFATYADRFHICQESYLQYLPSEIKNDTEILADPIKVTSDLEDIFQYRSSRPGPRRILMLATSDPNRHRPRTLLQAFKLIMTKFPDWNLDLCCYGEIESDLLNAVADDCFSGRVFLKKCEGGEEEALLKEADIVVSPAACDTFPWIIVKAMALGIPTIAFANSSTIAPFIINNKSGLLAEGPGGFYKLSFKIEYLINSPDKREEFGRNAAEIAKKYRAEDVLSSWLKFVKETANIPKAKSDLPLPSMQTVDEMILARYANEHRFIDLSSTSPINEMQDISAADNRRVVFYCFAQSAGGVEKLFSLLFPRFLEAGLEVYLLLNRKVGRFPFPLPPEVHILKYDLDEVENIANALKEIKPFAIYFPRSSAEDYFYIFEVLRSVDFKIPIICSEHTAPRVGPINFISNFRRDLIYTAADVIHLLQDDFKLSLPQWMHKKVVAIPNPLLPPDKPTQSEAVTKKKSIIFTGRLDLRKGILILIEAFHKVHTKHPEWELLIFGSGPAWNSLAFYIKYFDLAKKAHLMGHTENVLECLQQSMLFVLPSYSEGFSISIAEAMSVGVPSVAFSASEGPRFLIKNNVNGVLINGRPNSEDLAKTLDDLMSNPEKLAEFSQNCQDITAQYSMDKIAQQWLKMFNLAKKSLNNTSLAKATKADPSQIYPAMARYTAVKNRIELHDFFPNKIIYTSKKFGTPIMKQPNLAVASRPAFEKLIARSFRALSETSERNLSIEHVLRLFNITAISEFSPESRPNPDIIDACIILSENGSSASSEFLKWARQTGKPLITFTPGLIQTLCGKSASSPIASFQVDFSNSSYLKNDHEGSLVAFLNSDAPLSKEKRERAEAIRQTIIDLDLTTHNHAYENAPRVTGPIKVLIDANQASDSTLFWIANVALQENPAGTVVIKLDKEHGFHSILSSLKFEALTKNPRVKVLSGDFYLNSLLNQFEIVYTTNSLLGFYAAIRGKKVVCFEQGFYTGWGFTDDRMVVKNRQQRKDILDVIYATFVEFQFYFDMREQKCCNFETFINSFKPLLLQYRENPMWRELFKSANLRIDTMRKDFETYTVMLKDKIANLENKINKFDSHPI